MCISKFFKRAAEADKLEDDAPLKNVKNQRVEAEKQQRNDALSKVAMRQVTPFGTLYW